ncbi:MAG: hypothetical protein LKF88_04815 [Microbacteriaceae bacterium]|nr:hypothetical protein [Microbacteriaceae bacterium]MCI1207512.1 hypothetical protein [Microbacteriaceae bacterium]
MRSTGASPRAATAGASPSPISTPGPGTIGAVAAAVSVLAAPTGPAVVIRTATWPVAALGMRRFRGVLL